MWQACGQQQIMNLSALPLRWNHYVQSSPATTQTLWFADRVRSGQVLLVCNLLDISAGKKYSSTKAYSLHSCSCFSTNSGRRKFLTRILRQRLPGSKPNERNTDIPNARVTVAVLGSLKKEQPTKQLFLGLCLNIMLPMHLLRHHIRGTHTWQDFVKHTGETEKAGPTVVWG